jgi:hypothetical protein
MNIPLHFYKYRSLRTKKDREHTLRILTHNEIYFAKCKDFNDPFDCKFHIPFNGNPITHKEKLRQLNPGLSEAQIEIQTQKELQPENIVKWEKELNKRIRLETEKYGIFSMSAKRDNLLMWSHYADCHKGICMKFKTTGGKLFGCDLLNVDYVENYPNLSVYDNPDYEWVRKHLTTKSLAWRYEEEWRIMYERTGCQFLSENEELSGVILGARISRRNKELVLKCLSENNCKAKLYQARECKGKFGLDITLIE